MSLVTESLKNSRTIAISQLQPMDERKFEVVERKGVGHPDTIADGVAESVSNHFAKYCKEKYGAVLHHNVDKVYLVGGLVDIGVGYGEMLEPAKLFINGRMTQDFGGKKIDYKKLQTDAALEYIGKILPHLDIEEWIEIFSFTNAYSHNPYWFHPRDLDDVPDHKKPHANDTSAMVGYWPLSTVERVVLAMEGYFYDDSYRPKYDYIGQDIKVMAVRDEKQIHVTLCVPFISTKLSTIDIYNETVEQFIGELTELGREITEGKYDIEVEINTVSKDPYLLLCGSCIEAGEEGVVGRGNRINGLISSVRPYSMEAPYGKNPVYFVGKVHTVIAHEMAREISEKFGCEVEVLIITRNGENLYDPHRVIINTSKKIDEKDLVSYAREVIEKNDWTNMIIDGEVLVPKPGNFYLE